MRWFDIPAVAAIEERAYASDPWTEAMFWSELAGVPQTRCYLVAVSRTHVVGYAGLLIVGGTADVQTVAVSTAARSQGIGRLLLRELLAAALERGCHEVMLEVRSDNGPAIALYRGEGFEQLAKRSRYYSDGADALVMRLRPMRAAGTQPESDTKAQSDTKASAPE